ncbi:MAG: hypothetical protein A2787_04530 [Omnitrophica WOR_2 bacterium RIFCSPHIGHO2_01_FULL_48_9]|nr:MAG: hypothetical protein A2787_04530 [Omnitrophica WOR_2 bacterium RIFCSPHIGHO2_01_FULL_48_9]
MKRKKFEEEWTVIEKDTPEARASLDEGLRILARMILRRIMADRAAGKLPKEMIKKNEGQLNYEI